MNRARNLLVCVVVAVAGLAFAQQRRVRPGLYETTANLEIVGMSFAPPPQTTQHCITAEEAADAKKAFGKSTKDCVLKDEKVDGNKLTFTMECKGERGVMTGAGEVTYGPNSMESVFNMEMDAGPRGPNGKKMKVIRRASSKRVGDCK